MQKKSRLFYLSSSVIAASFLLISSNCFAQGRDAFYFGYEDAMDDSPCPPIYIR